MDAPDLIIFVARKKLSDQSEVFNVIIGDVTLAAVNEDAAGVLAEGIVELVEDHTNSTASVVYE